MLAKTLLHHSLADIEESNETDAAMLGHMMVIAARVAKTLNLDQGGYRIVSNSGKSAH